MTSPRCHVLIEQNRADPPVAPGEIRAFARCRNERLRLPAFLRHYRALGVNRFFIVDNGSSDGTVDYLTEQPDVHLFQTSNRYGQAGSGIEWMNALLTRFGTGMWCVTVDIDELLVYPGSEQVPLRTLTNYLDQRGVEALACMMLDMYPDRPLNATAYVAGDDPLAAAPLLRCWPLRATAGRPVSRSPDPWRDAGTDFLSRVPFARYRREALRHDGVSRRASHAGSQRLATGTGTAPTDAAVPDEGAGRSLGRPIEVPSEYALGFSKGRGARSLARYCT